MYKSLQEIREKCCALGPVVISVAVAQDEAVLEAVLTSNRLGIGKAILVGDAPKIRTILSELNAFGDIPIIHEPDERKAALRAAALVRRGEAQVLMKGLINSSDFLKAVLNPDDGLRGGRLLSHLAALEIPGAKKLAFHTDGGINVLPDLEQKKEILLNAVDALAAIGIEDPKIALLTANEKISEKMPATVAAKALVEMRLAGIIPRGVIEGPIALDVACTPEAAIHKEIKSSISGDVDLFMAPNIEAGNLLVKSLVHYANAKMAGIILGATHPVVLTSRADNAEGKVNSLALACLISGMQNKKAR